MKCRLLPSLKSILSGVFALAAVAVFAQPANDLCAGAIELTIAADEASATQLDGDTRNTVDAVNDGIPVCSANFYRDDLWYSFTAPDPALPNGFRIKTYFGTEPDDIALVGMALYASCDADPANAPIFCANEPTDDAIVIGEICPELTPGATYYVRVWSADGPGTDPFAGAGTFRIAAFENEPTVDKDVVIWGDMPGEGDFNGGINDWTTTGILCGNDANGNPVSADNAVWVWDQVGSALTGAYSGGQSLTSKTSCNGAMVFDSDFYDNGGVAGNFGLGTCPANQEGELISPIIDISASNAAGVSLVFHENFRHFQSQYFVGYSLDGGNNWIEIEINAGEETNGPHVNQETRVSLPGAEGSSNLRVKFRYAANYYYWVIDDVRIVETEANNMRANDFFARAPYAVWQKDQLTDFGALIDIENIGAVDQPGVKVDYTIEDEMGNIVASATKDYGTIGRDSLAENDPFMDCFELPADAMGTYTGTYRVYSDSVDFDDANNTQSFEFMISDDMMSKEMPGGTYGGIRASDDFNWTYGNYYYIKNGMDANGNQLRACEFELGISNADELTPSVLGAQASIIIYLYEWQDLNEDAICQVADETAIAGFYQYDFQDGDPGNTVFTFPLLNEDFEECVDLKDNTAYLLVVQYSVPAGLTEIPMFVLTSSEFPYNGTTFLNTPEAGGGLGSACTTQYGECLDVGNAGEIGMGGFTSGVVPVMRMLIEGAVSTDEEPLPEDNLISIFPNPVSDNLRVDFDFVQTMDQVTLRVSDMNGRTVLEQGLSGVQSYSWNTDVSHLTNGSYILYVVTDEGVRTERFMVQK